MDPNPLDPRFGRCPSSSSNAAATARRDPDHSSFLAAAAAAHPPRSHHRRAHSETFLRLPDDFLLDSEPDFGIADIDFPSLSDENGSSGGMLAPVEAALQMDVDEKGKGRPVSGAHLRSLSVDAAFFERLGFQAEKGFGGGGVGGDSVGMERKARHRHSSSMDGSTSLFEAESAPPVDFTKKAMAADKLAELALLDPKRAKRILANRQSAARSKERKIRYMSELERKVQTLQTEATTLSAQLTLLQKDTTDLTTENKELKLRLQAMEQQAHLRDALSEALREEVQRLRISTGQIPAVNGSALNGRLQRPLPQFFPHPQQMHGVVSSQAQQQQQAHVSLHPSSSNQPLNGQSPPVDSMDFV